MSLTPIGDMGIALKADVDDYHKAMRTSSDLTRGLTGVVRGLGNAMRSMGLLTTVGAGVAGAAMLTLSRRAERVNAAYREVASISSEVSDVQGEYGELVSELNTEYGLQTNRLQTIEALYQSVSASVDEGEESQRNFLTTAADLATVGLVDLETSVDVLSTAMNAYGEDTDFAEEASIALFQTVQFGKVRLEELAPVMGRITALGAEMGTSIQEVGASMAVLTRTGFEARVAATGLRAILRSFMRPSEAMESALRDIAMEQGGVVESLTEGHSELDGLASQYRETTDAIEEMSEAQANAREEQEESSLLIQEARLKISAIEEGRVDEIDNIVSKEIQQADTVEELESKIENYQFTVNKARVEEEKSRLKKEELEEEQQSLLDSFKNQIDASGDLEGGIGQLMLQEEGMIDTLVDLRKYSDEQNIAFDELFPRTRALQGALALVGEDGQELMEVFQDMSDGTFDAEEAWAALDEKTRENFDSFEEFKAVSKDMKETDLGEMAEDMRGPQQQMRNAVSKLSEAAEDLGQVFNEDVTNAITDLASIVNSVVDRIDSMDDSVRSNIGRFGVLAVTIGLALGPLLFFGGQLLVMVSIMGAKLLPIIGLIVGAFALFAYTLSTAASSGEEAGGMLSALGSFFTKIVDFLMTLRNAFVVYVLPNLYLLGEAFINVFSEISSQLEGFGGTSVIWDFAYAIGRVIRDIANFLNANSKLIGSLVRMAADIIVGEVIPAFVDLADGVIAVIQEINWMLLGKITASILVPLLIVVLRLVGAFGRFLQFASPVIGFFITWGAIAVTAGAIIFKVVSAVGALSLAIPGLISSITSLVASILGLILQFGVLGAIKTVIIGLFPKLAAGISVLFGPIGILIGLIVLLAAAWATDFANIRQIVYKTVMFLVDLFKLAIKSATLVPRLIIAAWKDGFSGVKNVLYDFFGDLTSLFYNSGGDMVRAMAKGMKQAVGSVAGAAKGVVSTVTSYFPSSPAEKGPFQTSPEEYGGNIPEGMSKGIEGGIGDVDSASLDMTEAAQPDPEQAMFENQDMGTAATQDSPDTGGNLSGMGGGMGGGVTVEEGAIKVGPFEGIADDEIPDEVREQVDRSLDELVEELEAKGVEVR